MKTIFQQCPRGVDANPDSYPHHTHAHYTRHGRLVICRGWFPLASSTRSMIDYWSVRRFDGKR